MHSTSALFLLVLPSACQLHAAEPAKPKPVKLLRTFGDFLAVMPKDLEPEEACNWTEASRGACSYRLHGRLPLVKAAPSP